MKMQYKKEQFSCPVEATLFLIGGKYKPLILWHLIEEPQHYMQLQRLIPKATPKMLSQQLHAMCNWGSAFLEGSDTKTCCNKNHLLGTQHRQSNKDAL